MKQKNTKIIALFMAFSLCLCLSACGSAKEKGNENKKDILSLNNAPLESQLEEAEIIDKTIDFDKNDISNLTEENCKEIVTLDPSYAFGAITYEDLIEQSDSIITGEIKDVYYTTPDRFVSTVADVLVTENFKGENEEGHIITMHFMGGYISAKDYAKLLEKDGLSPTAEKGIDYYYFHLNKAPEITVGENCLLFLKKDDDGSFFPLNNREGIFEETADGFKRSVPEGNFGDLEIEGETRLTDDVLINLEDFKLRLQEFAKKP